MASACAYVRRRTGPHAAYCDDVIVQLYKLQAPLFTVNKLIRAHALFSLVEVDRTRLRIM